MRLTDLLQAVGWAEPTGQAPVSRDVDVLDVTHDSQQVATGSLFVALPGRRTHGIQFASQALERGAAAIVTDASGADVLSTSGLESSIPVIVIPEPRAAMAKLAANIHGRPADQLTMLGVTGTNGKTTVSHLLQTALTAGGMRTGVLGTLGSSFEGEVVESGVRTTPESSDLQRTLAAMVAAGAQAVAMEVSSIAVDEHRVGGIEFDAMGFTGLSHDHLDYHGSMEAYFQAKARLFTPEHAKVGVVVVDSSWGRRLASDAAIPVVTVSAGSEKADWTLRRDEKVLEVVGPQSARLDLPVTTGFVAANSLLAIAIAYTQGIPVSVSAQAVSRACVPGRMERVAEIDDIDFVVDYAHSPDSIEQVVDEAVRSRALHAGRVIVVLGAGGDRDQQKRTAMGRSAASADVVVVTDDNPRTEDPAAIRSAVLHGAQMGRARVEEVAPRSQAIERAVALASPGDVVLVLGKGHEATQEIAGEFLAFDDREVLASFVRDRFGSLGSQKGDE